MTHLLELDNYDSIQSEFSSKLLWDLFDGNKEYMNLAHECLDRHSGKGRAISVKHDSGDIEHLDYDELITSTSQFAYQLEKSGIKHGERVAIILEPGKAFYTSLFGAIKRGAIAVPMFTLFGPDALALRIRDCTPSLIVADKNLDSIKEQFSNIPVLRADRFFLESLQTYPEKYLPDTKASDLSVFQYTSGTTRELPEAVRHTQRSVVTLMIAALYGIGLKPEDTYFCPSSPAWGHGLWHGTIAPLALGVHIVSYAGQFDPKMIYAALEQLKVNNFAAAATVYRMLRNSGYRDDYTINLSKCSFTGEPLDINTFDWIKHSFGSAPASMYGTTEVGVIMVDYPGIKGHKVKPGALGKPAPGNEVAILNSENSLANIDEIGEISVKRKNAWFRVKDFGYKDDEGYFFHAGRSDDVIISAGWTMSAVEIENTLLTHPSVAEAAVIGVADSLRGQVARAYVVLNTDALAQTDVIKAYMKEKLSKHEYPREINFVKTLPKTPAGKVNRKALRDKAKSTNSS